MWPLPEGHGSPGCQSRLFVHRKSCPPRARPSESLFEISVYWGVFDRTIIGRRHGRATIGRAMDGIDVAVRSRHDATRASSESVTTRGTDRTSVCFPSARSRRGDGTRDDAREGGARLEKRSARRDDVERATRGRGKGDGEARASVNNCFRRCWWRISSWTATTCDG